MQPIISIKNISKQYRLGTVGTGTLSNDLKRWWYNVRGKEDPFLKIGETNVRSSKGTSDYVWAIKDISFDVMPGEVLGIIGKNGAGKSTLLKILSKVTGPTTGSIDYNGRIGSLLEVGTGFHPELTGRENIFLNGAILGMTKTEIRSKLDEIVDFSGCERYIDTPVKRYSSGMMVRLGFAVAAHLEPEILVVDEVLAVGDAEFQKKAIGKMQDVSRNDGRTVLFVSHNMTAIENLCRKVCILENGRIIYNGPTYEGIRNYLNLSNNNIKESLNIQLNKLPIDNDFELIDLKIFQNDSFNDFLSTHEIFVEFTYVVKKNLLGLRVGFDLLDSTTGIVLFRSFHDENLDSIKEIKIGKYKSTARIPPNILRSGNYLLSVSIGLHYIKWYIHEQVKLSFEIVNIRGVNKNYADTRPGIIMPFVNWDNNGI